MIWGPGKIRCPQHSDCHACPHPDPLHGPRGPLPPTLKRRFQQTLLLRRELKMPRRRTYVQPAPGAIPVTPPPVSRITATFTVPNQAQRLTTPIPTLPLGPMPIPVHHPNGYARPAALPWAESPSLSEISLRNNPQLHGRGRSTALDTPLHLETDRPPIRLYVQHLCWQRRNGVFTQGQNERDVNIFSDCYKRATRNIQSTFKTVGERWGGGLDISLPSRVPNAPPRVGRIRADAFPGNRCL